MQNSFSGKEVLDNIIIMEITKNSTSVAVLEKGSSSWLEI